MGEKNIEDLQASLATIYMAPIEFLFPQVAPDNGWNIVLKLRSELRSSFSTRFLSIDWYPLYEG